MTTRPKTRQFEAEFAAAVGAKHAVAVNSSEGRRGSRRQAGDGVHEEGTAAAVEHSWLLG